MATAIVWTAKKLSKPASSSLFFCSEKPNTELVVLCYGLYFAEEGYVQDCKKLDAGQFW